MAPDPYGTRWPKKVKPKVYLRTGIAFCLKLTYTCYFLRDWVVETYVAYSEKGCNPMIDRELTMPASNLTDEGQFTSSSNTGWHLTYRLMCKMLSKMFSLRSIEDPGKGVT